MLLIYLEFIGITMTATEENKKERNFPLPYCPNFQLYIAGLWKSQKPCSLGKEKPACCPPWGC